MFDYQFPPELVAQQPLSERDASRLLVLDRASGAITGRSIRHLPEFVHSGDVLVINTSKVMPTRLIGTRESGGKVEVLLLAPLRRKVPEGDKEGVRNGKLGPADRGKHFALYALSELAGEVECSTRNIWWCLATRTNRLKPGTRLQFDEALTGIVEERCGDRLAIRFHANGHVLSIVDRIGLPPLPPYIDRPNGPLPQDRARYQTVYAEVRGSAAAPTAGLHFTDVLLDRVRERGAIIAPVMLHVGVDTFAPVRMEEIAQHQMHGEAYTIPPETMAQLAAAKREGRRVIAVGTTSVRALESYAATGRTEGTTHLYITPGYRFQMVNALLTNFHQPRSTLLMLVAAFAGLDRIRKAYGTAIAERYRLFSFGDAMLIV